MDQETAIKTAEVCKLRLEVEALKSQVVWWQNLYMASVASALLNAAPEAPSRLVPSRN